MPKESFEQFVKRQKEKLEKAEKMVEGVKEEWKEKIEEFEMVEKSVRELKNLWEENEKKLDTKNRYEAFSFFSSLPLPEVSSSLLERISNKFLKELKGFGRIEYLEYGLGLFLSAFLKKNIESYISSQKEKGIKEEKIKPIEVHLNVKEAPIILINSLGYRNPKKLHLIIERDCGYSTGNEMQGGKIIVEGSCELFTGDRMQGGEIIVKRNCGDCTGERVQGGRIIIEGNCGKGTGFQMKGGELNIKGEVKSFAKSAFSPNNKGTIIWKGIKIWENGNWTKEGKEMWERGEVPIIK